MNDTALTIARAVGWYWNGEWLVDKTKFDLAITMALRSGINLVYSDIEGDADASHKISELMAGTTGRIPGKSPS